MKVENNAINPMSAGKADRVRQTEKNLNAESSNQVSGSKDRAELSEQARTLTKAKEAFKSSPATNAERVQELKDKVQNGTYSVPVEKLADAILSRMREV